MDESYRYWLAAFQHMIGTKKYSQIALVEKVKEVDPGIRLTKGHLNAVYRERLGRGGKTVKASPDLQAAIARAYDYSFLDFVKAGQKLLDSANAFEKSAELADEGETPEPIKPLYQEWSVDELRGLSTADFDQKIAEYAAVVHEGVSQHANHFINRIKAMSKVRNHAEQERIQLQSFIEASSDAIKVNRADDKVVIYENQAYKRLIGKSLLWKPCPGMCGEMGEVCYVDEVKLTGQAVHTIRNWNGRWFEVVANPINKDGLLHSVVSIIRDITEHYSKAIESADTKARLQILLDSTSDTVNFFDENKQMVGSTSHHQVEDVERPTDLSSFILYAGNLFHGVTEAYEKLRQIYRDHQECAFDAVHKSSGKTWRIKATPVFNAGTFIGIMIVSREA